MLPDRALDLGVVPLGATITIRRQPSGWTAVLE
jgi:hypothetical protein